MSDVPAVLRDILSLADRLVVLNVACYKANALLPNGENAYITARHPFWWKECWTVWPRNFPIPTSCCSAAPPLTRQLSFRYSAISNARRIPPLILNIRNKPGSQYSAGFKGPISKPPNPAKDGFLVRRGQFIETSLPNLLCLSWHPVKPPVDAASAVAPPSSHKLVSSQSASGRASAPSFARHIVQGERQITGHSRF